jgi:hemerythrin-like domain-containing protein
MKDPIAILMQEHRMIELGLDALCGFGSAAASGDEIDRADLPKLVEFFREYADAKHHAKEEDILFQTMVANGFPSQGGPIAVMLHEHTIGRGLVGELAELSAAGAWTDEQRADVARAADEFADMLRSHIQREDEILYVMARQHLPAAAMTEVTERTDAVELDYAGRGETARLEQIATSLADRYAR